MKQRSNIFNLKQSVNFDSTNDFRQDQGAEAKLADEQKNGSEQVEACSPSEQANGARVAPDRSLPTRETTGNCCSHVHSFDTVNDALLENLPESETATTALKVGQRVHVYDVRVDQKSSVFRLPQVQGRCLKPSESVFSSNERVIAKSERTSAVIPSDAYGVLGMCQLLVAAAAAIVAILAVSQTVSLAKHLSDFPLVIGWTGYFVITLLWLVVVSPFCYLGLVYFQLRHTPGVSLAKLASIQVHTENRHACRIDEKLAESSVRDYLINFPSDGKQKQILTGNGFGNGGITVEEFFELIRNQTNSDYGLPNDWLESTRQLVVDPLEKAAARLTNRIALQVGLATAISPRGSFDALIVLVQSFRLVAEMCRLFGVRPGPMATCRVLFECLVSVLFAGGSDQIADQIEDQLSTSLKGALTAKLSARLGEGVVNGLFIQRIGHRLKIRLTPISSRSL